MLKTALILLKTKLDYQDLVDFFQERLQNCLSKKIKNTRP